MKAERHIEGYAVSPVVSLLMRGRERIVDGWCQGPCTPRNERVCASVALGWDSDASVGPAFGCLIKALPKGFFVVSKYNDHPTTTKADILSLYDRAIAMAIGESR